MEGLTIVTTGVTVNVGECMCIRYTALVCISVFTHMLETHIFTIVLKCSDCTVLTSELI